MTAVTQVHAALVARSRALAGEQGAAVARPARRESRLVPPARALCAERGLPLTVQALPTVDAHRRAPHPPVSPPRHQERP